uniref:Uncharacterized protein n=1 Tax=Ditylum brightwellii TaxID=49249 RepID=A0A7S4RLZ3_9STRA
MALPSSMSRTKTFRLLLEASLIFLPLVYFLVIFLKQMSVTSLVAIGTLLVGVILTSWETISFLHKETISVCHIIREKINTIVLDDVLRAIFSVDSEGLVMGVISSFVGTAGMYALPLNAEQRVRITQSCLDCCLEPSSFDGGGGGGDVSRNESVMKIDAGLILTKPGGFLSLLPTDWRTVLWTSLDESDTSEKDDVAAESEALLLMDNQHDKKRATERIDNENLPNENDNILMAQDMVWDDTDDDGDTDTTLNTADDSGISTNASPSSTYSSNKSSNPLSISRDQNVSSIVPNTPRTMPNMTNNDSNNTNDPFFIAASIIQEVFADKVDFFFSKIDRRLVGAAGSTAVVALLSHLRYSRAARQTMAGLIHGSIALGLASTAAGCGVISMAAGMCPDLDQKNDTTANDERNGSNDTSREIDERICHRDDRRRNNILTSYLTVCVSCYGKSFVTSLHQIARNERYKRLRRVLAFIFLFYFHQRRKRIVHGCKYSRTPQKLMNQSFS